MKHSIIILLISALLLSVAACGNTQQEFEQPANFYYLKRDISYGTEDGVIAAEQKETSHIQQNDLIALIQQYLDGPASSQLYSGIHSTVSIVSAESQNNMVTVTFSPEFALLSDIDLTLACSCVALTIMDHIPVDTVLFFAEGEILGDNGRVTITRDKLLLLDQQDTADNAN